MTEAPPSPTEKRGGPPPGIWVLASFLAAKLVWDSWTIWSTWPEISKPKLGVAVTLPVLIVGLLRSKAWALNLSGVACLFWIVFLTARLVGPLFSIGPVTIPFPWSNLLALPAIVYVINNLGTDSAD